jgi:predicted DNA binding protein
MWELKFDFDGQEVFFGSIAKKFNVELTGYPISNYEKNRKLFLNIVGTIKGKNYDKEKIIKFLKLSKYVKRLETNNDFFNILILEDFEFKPFYSPYFIHLSPTRIDQQGTYHYHIGSWQREELSKLLLYVKSHYKCKVLSFKQNKVKTISILGIQPNLTDKQRKVFELAMNSGYYEYPKKTNLHKLAKQHKLSYSAFQQHLRIAEKKINEFYSGKYT